jgi:fatty acid desaturase
MSTTLIDAAAPHTLTLSDADFKAKLQGLRQTDNLTNWWYIARTYLYLALVIGSTVALYEYVRVGQVSWLWAIPATLVAIVMVGAGQHQLGGLAHEGVHHILFRNRKLNDLASDWFTMFPIYGATHLYRLQHLAHHQFVNDPDRDPDVSQLQTSGHWLKFPVGKRQFLLTLLKQLWIPNLIRFMRVRAQYNATGTDKNPYAKKGQKPSKTAVRIGVAYIAGLFFGLIGLYFLGNPVLLLVWPLAMWAMTCAIFYRLPEEKFNQSRLHPVVPLRYMTMLRLGHITVVFTALANITYHTGSPAWLYYYLLWLLPLFTSYAFFMILRQIVQHGNADRSWLTNTRTFLVGRAINFAVFPLGQEYHLPHHMYATVPHYRLKELHDLLMQYPEYEAEAVVVEGYFLAPHEPKIRPTVLDVLGPKYARRNTQIYVDTTAIADDELDEKDEILQQETTAKVEAKQAHGE